MNPLELAAAVLEAGQICSRSNDLFLDNLPEGRMAYVALNGYGSLEPELTARDFGKHYLHEQVRFQCVVCDRDYVTAYNKARACFYLFLQSGHSENGCVTIGHFRPLQSPFKDDRDKNDRHIFKFNVEMYAISNLGD